MGREWVFTYGNLEVIPKEVEAIAVRPLLRKDGSTDGRGRQRGPWAGWPQRVFSTQTYLSSKTLGESKK